MSTPHQIGIIQADKAPTSAIKWKPLYDHANPITSKVLLRNTHTTDCLPWYGFSRSQNGKDYLYTSIPLSDIQRITINTIEEQVQAILQQHTWSQRFTIQSQDRIYPKYNDCVYYEKKDDGRLYRAYPDLEGELHNTPEKSLSIGALLHVSGVFFDYATDSAKLTYRLLSATYTWTDNKVVRDDVITTYLSAFGEVVPTTDAVEAASVAAGLPTLPIMDDVTEAVVVATTPTAPPAPESPPMDKATFLAALGKIRSINGVHKKMRQIQRSNMEAGFKEWCESEARKVMFNMDRKAKEKVENKKKKTVKPLTLQRDERHPEDVFKVNQATSSSSTTCAMDLELSDWGEDEDEAEPCEE